MFLCVADLALGPPVRVGGGGGPAAQGAESPSLGTLGSGVIHEALLGPGKGSGPPRKGTCSVHGDGSPAWQLPGHSASGHAMCGLAPRLGEG